MELMKLAIVAVVLGSAQPAFAQKNNPVPFRGDVASESASAVTAQGLEAVRGVRSVIIPQFTVEFVERSNGLSTRQAKQQGQVTVDYTVAPLSDAERQLLTDSLYARWVAGLKAQGLSVAGPRQAMATAAWSKMGKSAKPAPELIARGETLSRIFSADGVPYLMPALATVAPAGGTTGAALGAADTGAAVASKVGGRALGKLGGMFGMARGLGKAASSLGSFGGAWNYAAGEPQLAQETGAAVMTVRMVVGLRETDMAARGFGVVRTAGSYIGKPRLAIQGESTQITITPLVPNKKGTRAELTVPVDLTFQEDLLAGKIVVDNSAGRTASNVANRALFVGAVVAGGSGAINQAHSFNAVLDPAAHRSAVERNLFAIEDIFLNRLRGAW